MKRDGGISWRAEAGAAWEKMPPLLPLWYLLASIVTSCMDEVMKYRLVIKLLGTLIFNIEVNVNEEMTPSVGTNFFIVLAQGILA